MDVLDFEGSKPIIVYTGCPKKNSPLACCYSGANGLFFLGHPVDRKKGNEWDRTNAEKKANSIIYPLTL